MKKILSIISSAVLALVMITTTTAYAQMAKKAAGGPAKAAMVSQKAVQKKVDNKRFHVAQSRKADKTAASRLRSAVMRQPAKAVKSAKYAKRENVSLPVIHGSVIFNNAIGQDLADVGLYAFNSPVTQLIFEGPAASYGGVCIDGLYYAVDYVDYGFFAFSLVDVYDVETGEAVASFYPDNLDCLAPAGYALDPTTGDVYGITYNANADGLQLSKTVFSTSAVVSTKIADLPGNWNSIACDKNGQLYAISYTTTASYLNKIDKATGEVTLIGETGQLPYYLSGATIDPKSNRMFWNVCPADGTGLLCEVNLTTGQATVLFELEEDDEIVGMYVPFLAEDGAPASVTALEASFPEGAMSGTINFSAPTTLFDGTSASGDLTYKVLANGEEVATGTTTYGATVNAAVEMEEPGEYTFAVTVSNAAGASPVAKVTVFVGKGTPKAPAASLTYTEGKMNLEWAPVTASADGGYLNPAAVTYTVTRYPGAVEVATGLAVTEFSEEIAEPEVLTEYYYEVVAVADGVESAAGKSNMIVLGAIQPPYSNTFDNADALAGYTIIDANGDGKVWTYNNGAARISYNSSVDMDDWLITPPMKLEAGKTYLVSFKTYSQNTYYNERIAVKYGMQPTAAGLDQTILAPTDVTNTVEDPLEIGEYITPAVSGNYYIGFHGLSDKDKYYLFVDDISVSAPTSADAPGLATDIVVTPDPTGALKANVAFKAPAVNLTGAELASLTKVEVSRQGEVVKTFESPAVGEALSFDDVLTEGGNVEYSIQGFNEGGAGKVATASAFIGFAAPVAPTNVAIVETATPGEVTVSWDAVTKDKNGLTLPASEVTYGIYTFDSYGYVDEAIVEDLTTTSYTFQAVPAGEQDFVQYALFAMTNGGEAGVATDMIAVGTPYPGMTESFPDGTLNYILGIYYPDANQKASWSLVKDSDLGVASQDGDNGYIASVGNYLDYTAAIFTGKISLAGMQNPGVKFYTYNIDPEKDINEIQVAVKEPGDEEWTNLGAPFVVNELSSEVGWAPVSVSLAQYAGKVVQVSIQTTVKQYKYTMVDNIKIGNLAAQDLVASAISAPAKVVAGESYKVDVTVANDGMQASTADAVVELYCGAQLADSKNLDVIASGEKVTVSFDRTMGAVETTPADYYAKVVYAADENTDNNTTATVSVAPKYSNLPKVADLEGEATNSGAKLTWSEPDLSNVGQESVVDFEDGTAWEFEYEGWTFVDKDNSPLGGFQGTDLPGIVIGETTGAFFVFDAEEAFPGNPTFEAHSGSMYLACMFRYDSGTLDDWAISPELDGSAQTISFWAKSYSSSYPETIEMLYSKGGTDTADFEKVAEKKNLSDEWTEYTFDVPEGAKYFAIRSCATDSFMLMLDDFTFSAASSSANLSIVGYDVYRDGVKITEEPVAETEYEDTDVAAGQHTYVVVVVYTTGTSAPSNAVEVTTTTSGVDAMVNALAVKAGKGNIAVNGADGKLVTIAGADGKVAYSGVADGKVSVSVPAGVYVVKADKTVVKVVVK